MRQVGKYALLCLIVSLTLVVSACTQKPVAIRNYGEKFYGFDAPGMSVGGSAEDLASISPSSGGSSTESGSKKYVTSTVKKGDTLSEIAEHFDVPMAQIVKLNSLNKPYTLEVGQVIKIGKARYHLVARGDTLKDVAKDYDVSMQELASANKISRPDKIRVGQKLYMPGASKNTKAQTDVASVKTVNKKSAKSNIDKSSSKKRNLARKKSQESEEGTAYRLAGAPKFSWPVRGKIVNGFGAKNGGLYNDGINIAAPEGAPVRASAGGEVVYVGDELEAYGNLIIIKHENGWLTAYAHNKDVAVRRGQKIKAGEQIATVGRSGKVASPQLHFAVRKGREAVNPGNYL